MRSIMICHPDTANPAQGREELKASLAVSIAKLAKHQHKGHDELTLW